METFINVNKIISIKVVGKKEYLVNPWFYKVHEKGEHKYLITWDFLFFKFKLFKCKAVYEEDMFYFGKFDFFTNIALILFYIFNRTRAI